MSSATATPTTHSGNDLGPQVSETVSVSITVIS